MSIKSWWPWIFACASLLCLTIVFVWANTTPRRANFGQGLPIQPCPSTSANCVSSVNADPEHRVEALKIPGRASEWQAELVLALRREHNAQVVFESKNRVDVTFRSAIFRFPDDAEFAIDATGTVQFRSQSRVGHSDFGANYARIERIRLRLLAKNAVNALSF